LVRGNDHGRCLAEETLTEYLEGAIDPLLKTASEVHLISCDDCRSRLGFFMHMLDTGIAAQENQRLEAVTAEWDRIKTDRQLPRSTGTFPAWFLGFMGIAAALILGVLSVRFAMEQQSEPKSAAEVVQLLLARQRPYESRMADEPHIPMVRTRGVQKPGVAYGLLAREMTRLSADSHQMGRFYLLQKDFPRAIQYLEIASREVGATADVHNDLGVAYLESGDSVKLDQSGTEFQRSLGLDPSFAAALFNLALFYERENQPIAAAAQWKRYLELDPRSDWAKEAQGRLQGLNR
jgi:tetratricopeptide (TPR) repeat protein